MLFLSSFTEYLFIYCSMLFGVSSTYSIQGSI